MNPLRVALADDELIARKRLQRLLAGIPDVEIVGVHGSGDALLAQLAEESVDVVLLDIQMPGISGLETHARIAAGGPFVVFATAHPEHAVAGFDLGAIDYVLKPIDGARLAKAIDRARAQVLARARADQAAVGTSMTKLPITTFAGVVLVDPHEVSHAEFDGTLVTIHRRTGEPLLSELSLQQLAQRLPEPQFDRVHRRSLVNLHEVSLLVPQPTGGFIAVMRTGAHVLVSRQSARRLRRWLSGRRGADDE